MHSSAGMCVLNCSLCSVHAWFMLYVFLYINTHIYTLTAQCALYKKESPELNLQWVSNVENKHKRLQSTIQTLGANSKAGAEQ